jgi:hypothetical protein
VTIRSGLARLFGRRPPAPVTLVDDGTLVLLARSYDVERGDAAVLDGLTAAGEDLDRPVLVRHVFEVVPGADVDALAGGLEADGFDVSRPEPGVLHVSATTQLTRLTPTAAAQARARMTGLTTRHPVDYLGWEALVPPAGPS